MLDQIVHQILQALFLAIASGVTAIIVQTFARLQLRLSAEKEAKVQYEVRRAIGFAEEFVEAQLKKGLVKAEATAKLKLQEAIAFLLSKIPGLDSVKATEMITAGLGESPFGAAKSW